jgi:hypothetical protein
MKGYKWSVLGPVISGYSYFGPRNDQNFPSLSSASPSLRSEGCCLLASEVARVIVEIGPFTRFGSNLFNLFWSLIFRTVQMKPFLS